MRNWTEAGLHRFRIQISKKYTWVPKENIADEILKNSSIFIKNTD